ncbi:MAG TPA: ATP-dependent helicase C-terminal domain-containing protein, partial [Lacipirellulaceae bacterium]|nr:ATP-dependent helicase C-terminal domain-containing protein [Lacipirellulaceae bacterium]
DRVLPAADSAAGQFWRRAAWVAAATPELGWPALSREAVAERLAELCRGLRSIDELRQADWLSWLQRLTGVERVREIDRLAPADVPLPSGNRGAILYDWDQPPTLAVKIQELFGLAETPRIAGGRHALRLQLLGPNGRPQQVTTDLASFWQNTYPQVQKELRRRYPKHHWPDDPASAAASRSGLKRHAGP